MHRVARSLVGTELIARRLLVDQLDLVDHNAGVEVVRFSDNEEAIEHACMWLRLDSGEHDDDLIDICRENSFAVRATGSPTRELGTPWQDLADRPVVMIPGFDLHMVADRELERRGI